MKILYIGVHCHIGWGAEYWLKKAFLNLHLDVETIDYRKERKNLSKLQELIYKKSKNCNIIFLQRGDNLEPRLFSNITKPIIFWSTEPIQLKNDVDKLLYSNIFSWVYVHSYSCLERINSAFQHLINKTSIMHNAAPNSKINFKESKNIFAIFNRNLSFRRKIWLLPSGKIIKKIQGKYGDEYFADLQRSIIAVNIHYSNKNLDDFESGIFEAMASGCIVISEKLYSQTLIDLEMQDAIIQVNTPFDLKNKLKLLKNDSSLIEKYLERSKKAIQKNTWDNRAKEINKKIISICNE